MGHKQRLPLGESVLLSGGTLGLYDTRACGFTCPELHRL